MQQGKPALPNSAVAANLDTSTNVVKLLKDCKILNELSKGVSAMKTFIYPSVLQVWFR